MTCQFYRADAASKRYIVNAVLAERAKQAFTSVRGQLLFWLIAATLPLYAGALYLSYQATARRLENDAQHQVDQLTARLAGGVDAVIRPIEGGIRTVAYQLEENDTPQAQYSRYIFGILKGWPDVYGSTIAVEVEKAGAVRPFAPYYFRRADAFGFSDLAHDAYAYRQLPWYRRAADSGQPVWSPPYFDAGGGNTWMVTYSVPYFRKRPDGTRAMAGVVTADLDLNWMRRAAVDATLGPIGMGWLISPSGGNPFVAAIGATDGRIQEFDRSLNPAAIRAIGEEMLARNATFALLPGGTTGAPAYLAVRKLQTLEWRVMLVIPQSQLLSEAAALLNRQLWSGAIGILLLTMAAVGLRQHIKLRAENLAEQARLERDLHIAASIQQSMLPKAGAVDLPPDLEVAAALRPARHVGGDLYDYFCLADGSVLFAIGDVSDKGVPAALFMARLSALLRVKGAAGLPLDRLLTRLNARLADGNDACMFATIGCGVLDIMTGRVRYVSAGHEPPLLRQAEGGVRSLTLENGPAIGIEASASYRINEVYVAPGDLLLLYTDGVTEAEAHDGTMFGIERLSDLLRDAAGADPAAVVTQVVDSVAAHASGFHATDDVTVVAARWTPRGVTVSNTGRAMSWHIQVELSIEGIRQAQARLRAILAARDVAAERISEGELIAEELLTNIVRASAATQCVVDCSLSPSEIVLTFRDDGLEFDPLSASRKIDTDIVDREIGGFGIVLVTHLAQRCSYSRLDGWNILEVRLERQL